MITVTPKGIDFDPDAKDPLQEAIILSLFLDVRKKKDDPFAEKGWWGDRLPPLRTSGSRLWALWELPPAEACSVAKKEVERALSWLEPEKVEVLFEDDTLKIHIFKNQREVSCEILS